MTQTTPSATAAICTAATCTAATSTAAKETAIVVKCFFDFFAFLLLSWPFLFLYFQITTQQQSGVPRP